MNKKQKIIVSVTGIFIVLLILIGLTYAYFLTRITGNGNPTSITVTTANLELVYGDGTTAILTSENPLMPSSEPIGTKDFTVTNNGDDSGYVVVFEDILVTYAADTVIDGKTVTAGIETNFESNDFVYTLTCVVEDKSGTVLTDKSCNGINNGVFPMDGGIVVGNNIDEGDVHKYVLTLYYKDSGSDQSDDMNKTLNGKVNIKDIKSINPYSENTDSLAYNIINNSKLNKNGTELLATPLTKVAEEINLETEKVLSVTQDDYGVSYYYRGTVEDNYVVGVKDILYLANTKAMNSLVSKTYTNSEMERKVVVRTTIKFSRAAKRTVVRTTVKNTTWDVEEENSRALFYYEGDDIAGLIEAVVEHYSSKLADGACIRLEVDMTFEPVKYDKFIKNISVPPYSPFIMPIKPFK